MRTVTPEQLLRRTDKRGKCRVWTGTIRSNGMPQLKVDGKNVYVTRLMYGLVHPEEELDGHAVVHVHTCNDRACIAPSHLVRIKNEDVWQYRKSESWAAQ